MAILKGKMSDCGKHTGCLMRSRYPGRWFGGPLSKAGRREVKVTNAS